MQRKRFRHASVVKTGEPLIVVDAGIPDVRHQFEGLGRVMVLPAQEIDRSALQEAHAVIVRSITRVDASLLRETPVRFVGTATSGIDHVDRVWLRQQGIGFAHARGANAESVVDYVIASLLRVLVRREEAGKNCTVGIIGVGNVGRRLAPRLMGLGWHVLLRDPPRERRAVARSGSSPFVSMDRIFDASDIVTLHTPLIRHGRDRTHHLVDGDFLARMKDEAWLVNTARGPVVDQHALAVSPARIGALVMDVWENEPMPAPALVTRADIATAHIAGYALDSKLEATRRMARALARHFGRESTVHRKPDDPLIPVRVPESAPEDLRWVDALAQNLYSVERDDHELRRVVAGPAEDRAEGFEALRRSYGGRRLFSRFGVVPGQVPEHLHEAVFSGLGLGRLRR